MMAGPSLRMKTILVVDDEEVVRKLLKRHLTSLGYNVLTADSGEQALASIAETCPDLIFLDIKMAGMGGIECLRQLQKCHPELTVIMLTAVLERDMALKAVDYGATDYMFKPVDLNAITSMASHHL